MTLPVPHRGRTPLILATAALAALLAGSMSAQAQNAPAAGAAAPAAPATAKKPAAKPAAAKSESASYSVGISMGEQLRASGVTTEMLDSTQLAAGVRDAVAGKASLTDKDRDNIRTLVNSVGEANHRAAAKYLAENAKKPNMVTTASGLQYKVVNAGNGASPKASDEVTVNYRGTLINGTEFDSSYKRGQPATFPVNRVIPGWTEALQLMKPGAKYQLFIPPQLAYDLRSQPPIPPGSMLIFEVELLSVKEGAPEAPPGAAQPPAPTPTPAPKADGSTPK
jgi:FKBP-type peptidyl-prolyl cis-trans isomerase FkpA